MINLKLVSDVLSYLCISIFKLKVKTYENSCQFQKKIIKILNMCHFIKVAQYI